jgi:6,7-dimethyl-8-ribityllumazine synthase
MHHLERWLFTASLLAAISCSKAPPPDSLCSYEPLPESARVASGQGAVLISGSTGDYVYLVDPAGKNAGNGRISTAVEAMPGEYRAKLNGSTHAVFAKEGTLTRCASGAVLVSGGTEDYYYLRDTAGTQLANNRIGRALDLFPGNYRIAVNNTVAEVEIKPGVVQEIKTGLFRAVGATDDYYYVLDSTGTQLANNRLSAPLALLPGKLTVKINNSTAQVDIPAGGTTELITGALVIQGATDGYYYVLDATGNQLANNRLNQPLSFLQGAYSVKVNNATMAVKVEAGKTSSYQTATLTVKGAGDSYYYVFDANGASLANNRLNQPLSLPEGSYSVKVGSESRPVTLAAAKAVVLNW